MPSLAEPGNPSFPPHSQHPPLYLCPEGTFMDKCIATCFERDPSLGDTVRFCTRVLVLGRGAGEVAMNTVKGFMLKSKNF